MIPKIIHQLIPDLLPKRYLHCILSVTTCHPEFEHRIYDDNLIHSFMKTHFSEYYEKFSKLPRKIMQIDMVRYFLLYKYGGIYIDADYYMFKQFDLLDFKVVLPINRESNNGDIENLGNCIFASEPNNPFFKLLIDSLFNINRTNIDVKNDDNIDCSIYGTGPKFVHHIYDTYDSKEEICTPAKKYFHPITNTSVTHLQNLHKTQITYGMHFCQGNWRNNKL